MLSNFSLYRSLLTTTPTSMEPSGTCMGMNAGQPRGRLTRPFLREVGVSGLGMVCFHTERRGAAKEQSTDAGARGLPTNQTPLQVSASTPKTHFQPPRGSLQHPVSPLPSSKAPVTGPSDFFYYYICCFSGGGRHIRAHRTCLVIELGSSGLAASVFSCCPSLCF